MQENNNFVQKTRRGTIKTVGSLIASSALLGSANAHEKAENLSVREYEDLTREISSEYGGRKGPAAMAIRENNDVMEFNTGSITSLNTTKIHTDTQAASIQHIEFNNGNIITQVVEDVGERKIELTLDGESYVLNRNEVEAELKRRSRMLGIDQRTRRIRQNSPQDTRKSGNRISPLDDYEVTENEFANADENELDIPVTGKAKTDTNIDDYSHGGYGQTDQVEVRCKSWGAAITEAEAEAWDRWRNLGDELSVEYKGDYAFSAGNVLASSECEMRVYIKDENFNTIRHSSPVSWSDKVLNIQRISDDFTQGLYDSYYGSDEAHIGMKSYVGSVAIGVINEGVINAMTARDTDTNGWMHLDNFYLNTEE